MLIISFQVVILAQSFSGTLLKIYQKHHGCWLNQIECECVDSFSIDLKPNRTRSLLSSILIANLEPQFIDWNELCIKSVLNIVVMMKIRLISLVC